MKKLLLIICFATIGFIGKAQTPFAHYTLNGNANDVSGNNLNGTVTGTVIQAFDRFGNANNAISFNGTTKIDVPDNPLLRPINLTVSAWVYYSSAPVTEIIISKNFASGPFESYALFSLNGVIAAAWPGYNFTGPAIISNQWHFVAFTFDDTNNEVKLYWDGILVNSSPYTESLTYDNSTFTIGSQIDQGIYNYFSTGIIDEVKIFYTVLTPSQVQIEYFGTESKLMASYPFNGNVNDNSGNNLNGTLNGPNLTTDRYAVVDKAYNFDGIDDYISIGNIDFAQNNYSFSYWVNMNNLTTSNTVISAADPDDITQTYVLSEVNNGIVSFLHRNSSGFAGGLEVLSTMTLPMNQWSFITCVKEGVTLKLYINGVLNNSLTDITFTNINQNVFLELGRLRDGNNDLIRHLNGKLDEVKIYNYALTNTQINNAFNSNSQFTLAGTTINLNNNCYRLTQASGFQGGSLWNTDKISLSENLTINANINLGDSDGGADGIAFVLQSVSNTVVGGLGGGIAYQTISPSLAVEFDTFSNGNFADPAEDHIGLTINGDVVHGGGNASTPQGYTILPNIEDGLSHTLKIEWIAATKNLKVTFDGTLQIDYTNDIVANIFSGNSNVFWGFTAATANAVNNHVICFESIGVPLPITLLSFNAKSTENGNELTWQTTNETNFSHFEIQRSEDAKKFEKIGEKKSDESNNYEYLDYSQIPNQNSQLIYYRLKMIDLDGKYSYSKIIYLQNEEDFSFTIYPNPVIENLNISANVKEAGNYQIKIMDEIWRVKSSQNSFLNVGQNQISFSANTWQKGLFFVVIQGDMGLKAILKFVK